MPIPIEIRSQVGATLVATYEEHHDSIRTAAGRQQGAALAVLLKTRFRCRIHEPIKTIKTLILFVWDPLRPYLRRRQLKRRPNQCKMPLHTSHTEKIELRGLLVGRFSFSTLVIYPRRSSSRFYTREAVLLRITPEASFQE